MGTALVGIGAIVILVGFLFGTGVVIIRTVSAPSASPSPPSLPAAQVVTDAHSPLRSRDANRATGVGRTVGALVGVAFIAAAIGVVLFALVLYAWSRAY